MTAETGLALAMLAFVGSHLLLSHPLRRPLSHPLGQRAFTLLYSLIAVAALGWVILAYGRVEAGMPAWVAPGWWWPVASGIMLVASILLVGSLLGNPAFPRPGAKPADIPPPRGVFAITRHPMNWSFILWALVHLSLWGSARNLIVAGGILVLAFVGSIGQDSKKRAWLGYVWRDWEERTSFVPFAALLSGRASWSAARPGSTALFGGLALWLLVTWYHAPQVAPLTALLAR